MATVEASLVTDRSDWKAYRFDQIAENITDRIDDPASAGVERYVGLEHLEADSLTIRRWGRPSDVSATKLIFRKGDIIFGRRRAYQRKLAVADFDGICSAHALVLRARGDVVLPEFLPFFLQSETFFSRALSISVGSLSPTINWRTLAKQEFALPPKHTQYRLANLLWAAEDCLESYSTSLRALAGAEQSLVDAIYSADVELPLAEVTEKITDGVHKRPSYVSSGVPFVAVENLTRGEGIDLAEVRYVSPEDHRVFMRRADPRRGDVLVSKDGTLGVARVVEHDEEFSIFVSVAMLRPSLERLDCYYLGTFFKTSRFRRRLLSSTSGSALKHIHLTDLRRLPIPLPSLAEQRRVVARVAEVSVARSRLLATQSEVVGVKQLLLQELT